MERVAKVISNSGYCSRREAEKLIKEGQVKIDGTIITSPALNISKDNKIEIAGQVINQQQATRLWLYYKPAGLIVTNKDPFERETIFENLIGLPRVISIGRLDLNSEGLLLLTNNGNLSRKFELPSNKIERVYKVRAYGNPKKLLSHPINLIEIDGIHYNPKSIKLLKTEARNSWFEVILTEGKNREIRKIFEYFGLQVNRLIRVKYGEYTLEGLKAGEYKEVNLI